MKNTSQNTLFLIMSLLIPSVVSAEVLTGLQYIIADAHYIIQQLIPVMIGLGFIGFAWGVIKYLFGSDKEGGKKIMLTGIFALFVMTSIWGIINIFRVTLFQESGLENQVVIPTVLPQ